MSHLRKASLSQIARSPDASDRHKSGRSIYLAILLDTVTAEYLNGTEGRSVNDSGRDWGGGVIFRNAEGPRLYIYRRQTFCYLHS